MCGRGPTYMAAGQIQYPPPRTVIFGKSPSISKVIRKKGAFLNAECIANPKNTTFPQVLACTWGDFRFYEKNRVFLVVLSAFGRCWAFLGEPAEIPGDTFGVQAWEENRRPPLIGDTRGKLMAVFVIYCISSPQKHPLDGLE